MRFALAAAALVMAVEPGWAQVSSDDVSGNKMMGAAAYALGAAAQVGGAIEIQSPSSALFHPYGLKAWKVQDCIYAYQPSTSPNGRVLKIFFRNLTGEYEIRGSTLEFFGVGAKPAVCISEGTMNGCMGNLVMRGVSDIPSTLNNTLFVTKHGCQPNADDLPGNRDPY